MCSRFGDACHNGWLAGYWQVPAVTWPCLVGVRHTVTSAALSYGYHMTVYRNG